MRVWAVSKGTQVMIASMKEHKGIDPTQAGQWKLEAALQRRLAPPDNENRHIVYTNISNTLEQCISSQAHVVGFAISYHDYQTHNSYYGTKKKQPGLRPSTSAGSTTSS